MLRITAIVIALYVVLSSSMALGETLRFAGIKGSLNTYISMQVLEEAYAKLGIRIELVELPAERALYVSSSGKLDGEVFRIANLHSRYRDLVPVPTAINELEGVVFVKKIDFKVNGWDSLKPYKTGGQVGVKFVERNTSHMNPYMVGSNNQLFKMLDRERIDVAVAAYVNGIKAIKEQKLTSIRALKPPLETYPLYHYLHKKHAHLIDKLNPVLLKMQTSGRIRQIREAYIQTQLSDP